MNEVNVSLLVVFFIRELILIPICARYRETAGYLKVGLSRPEILLESQSFEKNNF